MAARAAAAAMEMEDLVEEFLLRLPPDDPTTFVRAALVCKLWRRIFTCRAFRLRYRDFHRMPRLLGVIHRSGRAAPRFAPTSAFRPRNADFGSYVHDSHHGRVLCVDLPQHHMAVCDPIAGEKLQLPWIQRLLRDADSMYFFNGWNAAVLCDSSMDSSYDHLQCDDRHFLVVFINSATCEVNVFEYSSQTRSWTVTASAEQHRHGTFFFDHEERGTLAGGALQFMAHVKRLGMRRICRYDLDDRDISWIKLPPSCSYQDMEHRAVLTSTQYGGLGCARLDNSRLRLWSSEVGSDGQFEWAQTRVVALDTMLPSINRFSSLAAFVDGIGVFLVTTADGLFSIDLDSDRATKVCEGREINNVVPYVSFCGTGLRCNLYRGGTECRCIKCMGE